MDSFIAAVVEHPMVTLAMGIVLVFLLMHGFTRRVR